MSKKYKQLGSEKINSLIAKLGRRCQRWFWKRHTGAQGYIKSVHVTNQQGNSLALQTVTVARLLESYQEDKRPGPEDGREDIQNSKAT